MTCIKKVTHDDIWKTIKLSLVNKIKKLSNCCQNRIKIKYSPFDKFLKGINIPVEVKRE